MMKRSFLIAAAAAAAMTLSACAGIVLAPAGPYEVGDSSATLNRDWTDFSPALANMKKVRLLTIDGPLLNRLYLTEGLVNGDYLVPPAARKEATTPTYNSAMTVSEQVEFIADSVSAIGYERVTTSGVRPVEINGVRGVRFDFEAVNPDGLNYKGRGQAVKANDKLYVAFYMAPAEHYYQASLASAEATMDSVTF